MPASPARSPAKARQQVATVARCVVYLEDVRAQTGIHFTHASGFTEERYSPVANGGGVAAFDYDGDGAIDLYFITGATLPVDPARGGPSNALYRGHGDLTFEDVTAASALAAIGSDYGQGVAVGDWNNDGFPDIYLASYGPNHLYQNQGDGTFQDVTAASQTGDVRWSTSAAWFDANEDGLLDLYVCNYAQWTLERHVFCGDPEKRIRLFCEPTLLPPQPHALYLNQRDSTFREATEDAGILRRDGRGLGVVAADVNLDGHMDLYVANDLCPNFLFLGRGDGTFRDVTDTCGAALDASGRALSGMGVDAEDVTEDGLPDLFVTNFWMQNNTLYQNLGREMFVDMSEPSGLAAASRRALGWGTRIQDLNNDGLPDVFVANGHVDNNMIEFGIDAPYRQSAQVWCNVGQGRFEHVSENSGPYFATQHVGRAATFADLDNDGWMDVVVNHCDEQPAILHNRTVRRQGDSRDSWVRIVLTGRHANRDAVGTRLVAAIGDRQITTQARGGSSYLSAHDSRILIGLGKYDRVECLTIHWPSGVTQELRNLKPHVTYPVREP